MPIFRSVTKVQRAMSLVRSLDVKLDEWWALIGLHDPSKYIIGLICPQEDRDTVHHGQDPLQSCMFRIAPDHQNIRVWHASCNAINNCYAFYWWWWKCFGLFFIFRVVREEHKVINGYEDACSGAGHLWCSWIRCLRLDVRRVEGVVGHSWATCSARNSSWSCHRSARCPIRRH